MVGVCIMVISIVKTTNNELGTYLIDKALALDCVLFMSSALLSFLSIRSVRNSRRLEALAESIFLIALVSMAIITVIFAFEII